MGGFEFGSINDLDPMVSLYSFIGVVLFLIFFDYVTGVIEFLLERSPLYNRMLQLIYKELMLMGLVSFVVIMYSSFNQSASDHHSLDYKVLQSIDFAHILLFYVTLFFVLHAFYLMALSIGNEKNYYKIAAEEPKSMIHKIQTYSLQYPFWKYLFESNYWPFFKLKHNIEFHLLKDLFEKTYLLSLNFDFPAYLSLSYGRYALKTINRSLITWLVFLVGLVLNFCRIVSKGLACSHSNIKHDSLSHSDVNCDDYTIRIFLASGVILSVYFLFLVGLSQFYKGRLLSFGEIKEPSEYLDYLRRKENERLTNVMTEELHDLERYHNRELKHEIEHEFHSNEEAESEEEPEIVFLATNLLKLTKFCGETFSKLRMKIRLMVAQLFSNRVSRFNSSNKQSLLTISAKKEREKNRRASDFHLGSFPNHQHSFTQNTIKKAEHIPLKKKLSVRFINHQRQSMLVMKNHHEEQSAETKNKFVIPVMEEKKNDAPDSPAKETAALLVLREGEVTRDTANETNDNPSSPVKRVSFLSPITTSMNKIIPEPTEPVTPSAQLKGKLNDLKHSYRSMEIHSIFLFNNPKLYFRAIELALMFTCLYSAIWATNMITMIQFAEYSDAWSDAVQLFMVLPIVWGLFCLAHIAEDASLLSAMTELNLSVVHDVLVQMEVTEEIVNELRQRFREILEQNAKSTSRDEFIDNIFNEIDEDGSGFIDRDEFRGLLRKLQITFSNYRFKLLYRVIDAANDGLISRDDFKAFIVPNDITNPASVAAAHRPRFTSEDIGNEMLSFQRKRSHTAEDIGATRSQRKQLSAVDELLNDENTPVKRIIDVISEKTELPEIIYEDSAQPISNRDIRSLRLESLADEDTNYLGLALETDGPLAAHIEM